MTSREHVLTSLAHRQPDKIPVDFGSTAVTGIHVNVVVALREYFGLEKHPVKVHEPYQMLGLIEEDLQEALGVDVTGVTTPETLFGFRNKNWKLWRLDNGLEVLVPEHFLTSKDSSGNTLIYPKGDRNAPPSGKMPKNGYFFDAIIRQQPIDEEALNPEDNLEEFGAISQADLHFYREETQKAAATGRAVMMALPGTALGDIALVPAPFLKHPRGIRDVEEWYLSTIARQDYLHAVFDKQTKIALQNLEEIKQVVRDTVDTIFICGTDFGTQTSTFCSPETFRSLYLPYYRRMTRWIHQNTPWKVFKHSCGAVESLIPDFIECGFDILNPVQISAAGMEAGKLKQKHGKDIVFWGGGIDTQSTLAFQKPQDVREQVLRNCEIFSAGGGFVFNTVHNIQGNTPLENVVAMIHALHEFNGEN